MVQGQTFSKRGELDGLLRRRLFGHLCHDQRHAWTQGLVPLAGDERRHFRQPAKGARGLTGSACQASEQRRGPRAVFVPHVAEQGVSGLDKGVASADQAAKQALVFLALDFVLLVSGGAPGALSAAVRCATAAPASPNLQPAFQAHVQQEVTS